LIQIKTVQAFVRFFCFYSLVLATVKFGFGVRNIFSILILIIAFTFVANSQETSNPCRKSTEGIDFWFSFLEGRWDRNNAQNHFVEITVTARESTNFTITIGPDETPYLSTFTVNANSSRRITIPWNLVEPRGSEKIENKGIHLLSEKPVNVYALNFDSNSADVAVIYPVQSLGKEHFAMCYYPDVSGTTGRNSEFLIVATEDSTTVEITPSKVTDQNRPKDTTFAVILNKGQIYQVQSENFENSSAGQGDLTSSHVISDKPIAFYSGSHGTRIPNGLCCWDHLYEQIPPIHSWGREYFTVPLKSREQDRYRIMAAADNTTIQITGLAPFILNKGQFSEKVFYYNEPKRILSDKPILVAQYSQSRDVDKNYTGGNGDPFMIILSSTTQSKNNVTFVAYESNNINDYYINIITLTKEVANIRLDGLAIANDFHPFPDSKYSFAQKAISSGTRHIYNVNEDRGFLAYVYGYGGVESYGYGVGFNLDLVLDLGESINFHGDTLLLCNGDSRTLDAGPYFDEYKWNTGDSTQTLTVTEGGKYYVKTTTIDGCELEDSIFVYLSDPKVDLGIEYREGCSPYSIELNGNDGFEKYVWQNEYNDTLSTNQIFEANQTNEYRITVFDEYNCPARDTMNLVVFPVPKINIEGESLICGKTTSEFSVQITDAPDSIWNYEGSFTWSSNNPELQVTEQTHQSSKIEVSEWGKYEIYYRLKTLNGCISNDTFLVSFHPTPTSNFDFVEDPDDKCKGYSRQVLYVGNATENADFYWDYGGSKLIDSMDWNNFIVSIGAFNSNPNLQLYIEEYGCWSDTTIKAIGANPDFNLETGKARGCDSMTVLFKGKLNVTDSLLFEWDFGDNSPISNLQTVEHFYPKTGAYDVGLTITNLLSQCQIGFQIDSMIKVFPTPTAAITADPLFCYPDSANLIYTHNIDSSFCNWSFEGAHQTGVGNDSITIVLDDPFGKATLVVDEFGCLSEPFEITLKRKPHFDFFTANEEGCQPYTLEIIADPKDEFLDFTWLTDSLPYPSGNSNLYVIPDSGKMDITLISTSQETGCWDTLIKSNWIWVHPKPIAAFEVINPSALIEHADILYTNLTEYATDYFWDFGDDFTSIEKDPSHTFTQLGEFNSQLFANSDYGCKDTTEFVIKVLPFTVFTPNAFRPNSEIQENRTFMPVGVGADISRFSIKIFDRWGQMVFEADTPEHFWDGTTKNGTPAPMGNYVWTSHYFDIQGFVHNQKGQVLLMR